MLEKHGDCITDEEEKKKLASHVISAKVRLPERAILKDTR